MTQAMNLDRRISAAKNTVALEPGGPEVIQLYNLLCNDLQGVCHGKQLIYAEGPNNHYVAGNQAMRERFDKNYKRFETIAKKRVAELEG